MNFIVVVEQNYGIGINNKLLTHLPKDLKRFRRITLNKVLIMGRKTLESLPGGKPFDKRINIVLSRDINYEVEGAIVVHSLDELFEVVASYKTEDIFVVGGATIYNSLMPFCEYAYITKIDQSFKADTFINNVDELDEWRIVEKSQRQDHNGLGYYYTKYINTAIQYK